MSTSIVCTTIHVPSLLAEYCENARTHGHRDVNFIIIGDKATPPEVEAFCGQLTRTYSYSVDYYGVERQLDYLKPYPELAEHIPFNATQRRNIGLLRAFEMGSDVIVMIDDDNFVTDDDFVGDHAVVGLESEWDCVSSDSGWYNVCQMLVEEEGRPFYHRGFPMQQRWKSVAHTYRKRRARAVVNAGLRLDDPDIAAITRMDMPIRATALRHEFDGGVALDSGTWCPFNSQNTALARDVIPTYFLSPHVGRYDDVWGSYVLRHIVDAQGDMVLYGHPLVTQVRNPHNLWKDLDAERAGMELTDRLVQILRQVPVTSGSYSSSYADVSERLPGELSASGSFDQAELDLLFRYVSGMRIWAGVFDRLRC